MARPAAGAQESHTLPPPRPARSQEEGLQKTPQGCSYRQGSEQAAGGAGRSVSWSCFTGCSPPGAGRSRRR